MVEVIGTDEFADWFQGLDDADTDAVIRAVGRLEERGVTLPAPYSSQIKGSQYSFRELRAQSQGAPLRILYAFDPKRRAVLLLGGDKTGDDRWYATQVPRAERIWETYLHEMD